MNGNKLFGLTLRHRQKTYQNQGIFVRTTEIVLGIANR